MLDPKFIIRSWQKTCSEVPTKVGRICVNPRYDIIYTELLTRGKNKFAVVNTYLGCKVLWMGSKQFNRILRINKNLIHP